MMQLIPFLQINWLWDLKTSSCGRRICKQLLALRLLLCGLALVFHGQRADHLSPEAAELSPSLLSPRDHSELNAAPVPFLSGGGARLTLSGAEGQNFSWIWSEISFVSGL